MLDFVASGIRANKFGHRIAFYLLHFLLLLFLFCFFFFLISATFFFGNGSPAPKCEPCTHALIAVLMIAKTLVIIKHRNSDWRSPDFTPLQICH